MKFSILLVFVVLAFWVKPLDVYAFIRYAIVIGNNNGVDENGNKAAKDLAKAEEEAKELYDSLIDLANFKKENIILLKGTSKSEVMAGVQKLKEKMDSDAEKLHNPDTLFALFFTGHGSNGQLLIYEAPLTAQDINIIFKEKINAKVELGFFDACFSGSLDPKVLKAPNILDKLPQDVLQSQGSVWFTSSKKDQYSHEDKELGGVFTHFFIEREPDTVFKWTFPILLFIRGNWVFEHPQMSILLFNKIRVLSKRMSGPRNIIRNL